MMTRQQELQAGKKRSREEYLAADHDAELASFVKEIQSQHDKVHKEHLKQVHIQINKANEKPKIQTEIQKKVQQQEFGASKRRIINSFASLSLDKKSPLKATSEYGSEKEQEVDSDLDSEQTKEYQQSVYGKFQNTEMESSGENKTNFNSHQTNFSSDQASYTDLSQGSMSARGDSKAPPTLRIADPDLEEDLHNYQRRNFQQLCGGQTQKYFNQIPNSHQRSRSQNLDSASLDKMQHNQPVTGGQIELRTRMMTPQKLLLSNFFSFYLKNMLQENENLNLSYIRKIKEEYAKLNNTQHISFNDLCDSVNDMDVDEVGKAQIIKLLVEQTNFSDLLMQEQTNINRVDSTTQESHMDLDDQ